MMLIYRIPQALRLFATAVIFASLIGCGTGEGPEPVPDTATPPPTVVSGELLTNGTFESGDTSGWVLVENSGTFTATMDQAASGSWSGNLVASVPGGGGPASFPVASQNNLAVGTVTPGQSVTVSFDICGELTGAGGVVQTALLSEISGGGASATDALFGNITPTDTWVNHTMTTLSGPDVSGGITLQLKSDCGGNPGCTVNAYFDNVSVVLDSDVGNPSNAGGNCVGGGGPPPPPVPVGDGIELLTNGDFETSATDKAPWINAGTVTTNNFYTVDANNGGNVFDTNLSQVIELTNGVDYVLSFRARASVERDAVLGIGDSGSPFVATLVSPAPTFTTEWQSFSFPLTATNDGGAASRVLFDLGTVASTVDIDDVSLVLASAPGVNLLTNGDFETSGTDKAPWINAGTVTTNNFYTVDANNGGNVFDTNLSQVIELTNGVEYVLSYRARASAERDAVVGIGDSGSPFVATLVTPAPTFTTEWQTFTYALTATNDGGAASRVLFDLGTVASTVDIDDVSLQVIDTVGGGGGSSALVNGDFETGDFTGWTQTPDAGTNITPGIITLVTSAPGGRAGAVARLEAAGDGVAGSQDVLLTQVLAAGTLNVGDTIDVSFDLYGSLAGAGGVVFVELIYLDAGGVDTGIRSFVDGGAPKTPTTTWSTYSDSIVVPAGDVSGGVKLQLKSSCGPVDGCGVDAYFDNVTTAITP